MVGRDNPNCSARLISLSRRSPGARSPSLMARSICWATWKYRGTGLDRSRSTNSSVIIASPRSRDRSTSQPNINMTECPIKLLTERGGSRQSHHRHGRAADPTPPRELGTAISAQAGPGGAARSRREREDRSGRTFRGADDGTGRTLSGARNELLPTLRQPGLVSPRELVVVPDDGCVLGRRLEKEAVGISLQYDSALQVANLELVLRLHPRPEWTLPSTTRPADASGGKCPFQLLKSPTTLSAGHWEPTQRSWRRTRHRSCATGPELVINPASRPPSQRENRSHRPASAGKNKRRAFGGRGPADP